MLCLKATTLNHRQYIVIGIFESFIFNPGFRYWVAPKWYRGGFVRLLYLFYRGIMNALVPLITFVMEWAIFKPCEYNIFSSDTFLGIKAHLSQSWCVGANLFWHLLHFCNKYSSIKIIFRLCFVYFRWWLCSRKETISYITRFLPALLQNSHFPIFLCKNSFRNAS